MDIILSACQLRKIYRSGEDEVRALDGLDVVIQQGEFAAVMGASGSGKSTFLHLAGGLDTPTSGSVEVGGQDLSGLTDRARTLFRRRQIGIVFQQFNLLPNLTAIENVGLPMLIDGVPLSEIKSKTQTLLEWVDLHKRGAHKPQALSGGEQQRVAIARALMNDPAVVLADEPTGNLDSHHAVGIWKLMRSLAHEHRKTIVMVTHEAQGAAYADRVLVLRDGKLRGEFKNERIGDAAMVAARYQELAD